jgi:hypothetical protein
MIGHSVERATGEEAVEAVYWHAHLSHQIKKVAANTPYTNLYIITCIMPPNVNISPPPSVITSTTTIWTTFAGGITSDMRMGGDNIPQYIPTIGGGDFGMLEEGYWTLVS